MTFVCEALTIALLSFHGTLFAQAAGGTTSPPLGDINIIAVTDVHAWLEGGDRTNPNVTLDATFGDLISFTERMKILAQQQGTDVFLVDNGDVIDGTGLSNLASDHCSLLLPVLKKVPFDALNCGNHELYDIATLTEFRTSGYISHWNGRYLTANVFNTTTGTPIGATHYMMRGVNTGVKVLTFGFMYDMQHSEGLAEGLTVNTVEFTVANYWFKTALDSEGRQADAILLLCHMDAYEPLLTVIVKAIRKVLPSIPIQIIAGHSHMRQYTMIDDNAAVFEPGNFFNTVGFASITLNKSKRVNKTLLSWKNDSHGGDKKAIFNYMDIDTSTTAMSSFLNQSTPTDLPTPDGASFSKFLNDTVTKLGLNTVLGCSPETYLTGKSLNKLYVGEVIPLDLFLPPGNVSQWFVAGNSGLRYGLYSGPVTVDDIFKVLPFQDTFFVSRRQTGVVLNNVLEALNGNRVIFPPDVAASRHKRSTPGVDGAYITTNDNPEPSQLYDVIVPLFDKPAVMAALAQVTGSNVTFEPFRAPWTDTDVLMNWARTSLYKKCNTNQ